MTTEFDTAVKLALYRAIAETASAPAAGELGAALGFSEGDVLAAFARLHARRLLVPEPGDPSRIRMAPPFSGVPTPFPMDALGKRYYANCVWDAYGIPAALNADAVIPASDGFSGDPLLLEIRDGRPILRSYVSHFAVPAARWWEDIVYT